MKLSLLWLNILSPSVHASRTLNRFESKTSIHCIKYDVNSYCINLLIISDQYVYHLFTINCVLLSFSFLQKKAAAQIEDPNFKEKLNKLNAAIHYGEGDLSGSRSIVEQNHSGDLDSIINLGCLFYREGDYQKACQHFQQAIQVSYFLKLLLHYSKYMFRVGQ